MNLLQSLNKSIKMMIIHLIVVDVPYYYFLNINLS